MERPEDQIIGEEERSETEANAAGGVSNEWGISGAGHATEFEERLKAYKARLNEDPVREPIPAAERITSGLPQKSTIRIGDILVEQGVVARQMVEDTAELQKFRKKSRLGKLLLKRKAITETHLARALAFQHGVPFARLGRLLNASEAFTSALLPVELISRFRVIPVGKEGGRLLVALEDPTDLDCLKELESAADCPVDTVVSTPAEINYIEKNFTAKEARLAAERATVKERTLSELAAQDKEALELRREAEKEVEETRLAVQRAEHEERQAANQVVSERVAEEKEALEACLVQEKAAMAGRHAAEQKVLADRFAQDTKNLERKLQEQQEALARWVEEEHEAAERFIAEQVNAERFALEARFTVQLNAAVEKLRTEKWMFEEQLAAQRALTVKAQAEKEGLDRELAQALNAIKSATSAELEIKPPPRKKGLDLWMPRLAAAAAIAAVVASGYFNIPRGGVRQETAAPPPPPVAVALPRAAQPESAPSPLLPPPVTVAMAPGKVVPSETSVKRTAEPELPKERESVKQKSTKREVKEARAKSLSRKEARLGRTKSAAKQETVAKRAKPTVKPESQIAKATPIITPEVKPVETAPASAFEAPRLIEPIQVVQRQESNSGGFASNADRRAALRSLESRMSSGNVLLARLEEKLAGLMRDLEKKERELASDKSAIEGGEIRDSSAVDRYNAGVSRYNKLLSYTRQVAAECDSVRRENHELSVQYRSLAVR